MKTKCLLVLVGVLVSAFLLTPKAFGSEREYLRGLKGVYVLIENLREDIEKDGLTKMQLRTDVELRLRKAGIRVLTEEEYLRMTGHAILYVKISSFNAGSGYAFHIEVSVDERATLVRNTDIKGLFTTWSVGRSGLTSRSRRDTGLRLIREGLGDIIDAFINDYLAVNPK